VNPSEVLIHTLSGSPFYLFTNSPLTVAILVFWMGLLMGSFLTVCIYRIPRNGLRLHSPRRSICPTCHAQIRAYDNIPVLSYLLLRGRCRHCRARIPVEALIVELTTGCLFLLLFYRFGPTLALLHGCLFISLLLPIAWIDASWYKIPNSIILLGLISGLGVAALMSLADRSWGHLVIHLLGAVIAGAAMALLAVIGTFVLRKSAMGAGDIKLMILIGLFLGVWPHLLIVIVASTFIGLIVGISSIAIRSEKISRPTLRERDKH